MPPTTSCEFSDVLLVPLHIWTFCSGLTALITQAGFSVSTSASAPDSSLALGGEILKVYADAYFAYSAEVSLFVRLTREGREILGHSYVGTGSAGTNVTATAKSYAQSLALALADALRQVVPDVEKAIASE